MGATYRHNYTAFRELVLKAPWMEAEMLARAEKVARRAKEIAPVDETGPHPGRYRDSITASVHIRPGAKGRAVGVISSDAPEARFIEFGTEKMAARRTLALALDVLREA